MDKDSVSIVANIKTMTPTYSIIIPHKGIPDLLMRCLRSIPVSEDIQVIVVDDNSADADTYLDTYPELSRPYLEFIRTKTGGGAGYARNVGLDRAKGKWLLFADADDFFVEDMHDIISSYVDSEADVIYFKNKAVLSENINIESNRCSWMNRKIDQCLKDGDEWPVRFKLFVPWAKMVKRDLVIKYNIRFDEVVYSADVYFFFFVGYHAGIIKVANITLYVVTFRPKSLSAEFCTKPGELKTRAEVFFREEKFLIMHNICRVRSMRKYLLIMLKRDHSLFKYYFYQLDELYPSKLLALHDIGKGTSLLIKIKLYIYSLLIWARIL